MNITFLTVSLALAAFIIGVPLLGMLISFIVGLGWSFVWRSSVPKNYVLSLFCIKVKPPTVIEYDNKFVIKNRWGSIYDRSDKKWWEEVFSGSKFHYKEGAEQYILDNNLDRENIWWAIFPLAALVVLLGAALHFAFWFTVYLLSAVASLYILRWICDLQKYAQSIKKSLDSHKVDPKAHKEE